jgi:transcription antitermination factor NusG
MTTKADYTEDEWQALRRAPMVAGFAVSLADPGGPIELTKESMAAMRAAGAPPGDEELLVAVSQDALAEQQQRHNVLKELDLKAATVRQQVVDELRRVNGILADKATPEEAADFRQWLVQAAQDAAEAAKEGGFLGIGATRVSEGEKAMLAQLREILGVPEG